MPQKRNELVYISTFVHSMISKLVPAKLGVVFDAVSSCFYDRFTAPLYRCFVIETLDLFLPRRCQYTVFVNKPSGLFNFLLEL